MRVNPQKSLVFRETGQKLRDLLVRIEDTIQRLNPCAGDLISRVRERRYEQGL